jgi:hypothetical protein
LVGISRTESRSAEQHIGINDLRLEGQLKLIGHTGTVVGIPLNMTLTGALSPAFLPLAQEQFETIVDQVLVKPAKVAFIAHIESVKAARGNAGRKGSQS